ncbi:MAG: aldose epimerase family protein [Eubacteriales bacterium]|nr:aldose epimerase family protein [Eubacteriales bacterium]
MNNIFAESFGTTKNGKAVTRYTMENAAGMRVRILDYGCTVQSILVPDKEGTLRDVVLGYDDIAGYEAGSCFIGAFVGRYANRIKGASFKIGSKEYFLPKNDGDNHLHGIFCSSMFTGSIEENRLVFRRESPAGEEGYPGTLQTEVHYSLTDDNALIMQYRAVTDEDTVVNLTNHSYYNLNGDGEDILGHKITIDAGYFTEVDQYLIPTGRILAVDGTPMDFQEEKRIGADIFSEYVQIRQARGYDHNYILKKEDTPGDISLKENPSAFTLNESDEKGQCRQTALLPVVRAVGEKSGIVLEVYTTQPGIQFYTGNYLDEDTAPFGKNGRRYPRYAGFCLETQHFPSSPTFPEFPSTLLHPGEEYRQTAVYRFSKTS